MEHIFSFLLLHPEAPQLIGFFINMTEQMHDEILNPEQIYEKIHAAVASAEGTDKDVLSVIRGELLNTGVEEKKTARNVVDKLLELALKRSEGSQDGQAGS